MTLGELRKLLAELPDEAEVMFSGRGRADVAQLGQDVIPYYTDVPVNGCYATYDPTSANYMRPPWTVTLS